MSKTKTGAENIKWDLSQLYSSENDPQLDADLQKLLTLIEDFAQYKGRLSTQLGPALTAQMDITKLGTRVMYYLFLRSACETDNTSVKKVLSRVQEAYGQAAAVHMTFFEHEVAAMDDAAYLHLLSTDHVVAHHRPMLDDIRKNAQYLLSEDVEQALTMRSPFGDGEWDDFMDEMEAELVFDMDGEEKSLTQMLHILSEERDEDRRYRAMKVINDGFADQYHDRFRARALNVVMGAKRVDDAQRGFDTPMSSRNLGNKVDDATVDALHDAVTTEGAKQAQRFYRLKQALMNRTEPFRWSDRNAPLPMAAERTISWDECVDTVLAAYQSFSPTLARLVKEILDSQWVDVPPYKGKQGGAFNASGMYPDKARSFNLLNYQGSVRDVMTTAHELGHGVHGLLAIEAQGALQWRAPMNYAETASIFGEMVTFQYLLSQAKTDEERLVMYMDKASDFMNTVVRQISFSLFEQRCHAKRAEGKLTVEDFNHIWMEVTEELYGKDGDLFSYSDMERLWCYVGHFMRPFYVYAYAFGELFTQSLFAKKDDFGDQFEPMYLELLRAGGTKDAKELMAPFGLDPTDPQFWVNGISASITTWMDEAEKLAKKLGYID